MSSERITLKQLVRLSVRNLRWNSPSSADHGSLELKKSSSISRAFIQDTPAFNALESGCLTANHPFVRGSRMPRIKFSQSFSSPCGIRSGFVKTPGSYVRCLFVTDASGSFTDSSLALLVMYFCQLVGTLVLKVGYVAAELALKDQDRHWGHTLACDREQDKAARLRDI